MVITGIHLYFHGDCSEPTEKRYKVEPTFYFSGASA